MLPSEIVNFIGEKMQTFYAFGVTEGRVEDKTPDGRRRASLGTSRSTEEKLKPKSRRASNTYTLTKSLAEYIVAKEKDLPVCILRPSIGKFDTIAHKTHLQTYSMCKRASLPPESRLSLPPIDTSNRGGVTSALSTSWIRAHPQENSDSRIHQGVEVLKITNRCAPNLFMCHTVTHLSDFLGIAGDHERGLMMMTFRGAFRTLHSRGQCIVDLIPVDMVVNNCILAAWRTGTGRHLLTHSFQLFLNRANHCPVCYFGIYQSSAVGRLMQTQHQVGHIDPGCGTEHFLRQIPFVNTIWETICQVVPAYVYDLMGSSEESYCCFLDKRASGELVNTLVNRNSGMCSHPDYTNSPGSATISPTFMS
ncbi:hypothetical protein EVAR_97060_1 [Eumeta japonica]|uniref:Fatty acyl-CoA reductase n=1 Tax=Eumeta variegata TaxID=151549 RepID=A0A4C2AB61_EUMVA|nr:hypothetical protein EVAR_97060_1 [Eumeta japonica]